VSFPDLSAAQQRCFTRDSVAKVLFNPTWLQERRWVRFGSEGWPGDSGQRGKRILAWVVLNAHPLVRMMPRDGGNILRLGCGLVEQLIEFARRELAAPAIRNANSVSGCFELAGFGNRDHRIDSVRLVASTVF
jgi:hypothetical protein